MTGMKQFIHSYLSSLTFNYSDVLEIIILSFVVYYIMRWIRNTRAWTLMKGILVMVVFVFIATILHLDSILFLFSRGINAILVAVAVIFQPELRRALEQLGEKKFLSSLVPFDMERDAEERFSDKTVNELIKGSFEMGKARTGALIVIEKNTRLTEYIRTGIELDSLVTSQLLLNIFEHNTPLHDGAIIVRGNRIISATCYLPLSDNMELSKELGTRHRAGVGISEVSDSLTIIVSEETGAVSIAESGKLTRSVSPDDLKAKLAEITQGVDEGKRKKLRERIKNERKTDA
jgi:diadenylate cyclase